MVAEEFLQRQADAGPNRIVVLPLTRPDGRAITRLLESAGIGCLVVDDIASLCHGLDAGADSVILAEEAVLAHAPQLLACLARQPMWSELPVIVLSKAGQESHALAEVMPRLGNISVIERPARMSTLLSLVRSNLRARQRQYQLRDFMQEREQLLESERFARSDAERAGRIKDEFLATLSHELRTPLNAVLGWTRVLRKSQGLTEEVANGLTVIERNARSQAQIIGDLLDMSSIISGKVRVSMQPLEMEELIQATIETARPAAEAKAIRLVVVAADAHAGAMRGDASRLQQVLWNLLANAVKFTPQGGEVTVKLSGTPTHVSVEVGDNGEGIDPVFLPHIFDRFRQADASSARRHGGLGLGLSIVRQLVELHGGTVQVHSAGPGQGSTFRLEFPVLPQYPAAEDSTGTWHSRELPAAPTKDETHINLAGVKILVVDDEPDSRALLERLLLECHATVVTAASADEAMLLLASDPPDLLVSDIGMPGTDGYAMLRRIRSLRDARAAIPAVAVTAYVRREDQVRAADAGFQAHLGKPVDPGELQVTVERLARAAR
jgi:signal transduction histidine kinase/ActR/RegA family two-component response regulator